jgi:hypothetical protein
MVYWIGKADQLPRHVPPKLRRDLRRQIQPRLALTIYCEGGNTEPNYFKRFAFDHGNRLVKVETIPAAGVPMTIVRSAIDAKRRRPRRRKNSFEEADQIWVAFDCDEHPQVAEAIRQAEENNVFVAFSNPCFELWAIIHLVGYVFNRPTHRHDAQSMLKELMPKYDPHGAKVLDYDLMKGGYEAACRQAKNMERCREEEGDPLGNPYTSVYRLVGLIEKAGKPES